MRFMGAPTKRASKVRSANEFDLSRLIAQLMPPKNTAAITGWTLADIVSARDQQMRGVFRMPARMAEAMRTDDALFVAFENRLAPQRAVKVTLKPAKGPKAPQITNEAEALFGQNGIAITPDTLTDIHGALVNHGVAFATNVATVRPDLSRVDYSIQYWPIEHVRWDPITRSYKTLTEAGPEEEIVHGDGRWITFRKNDYQPFTRGALLPAALVWARHAFANRDWAKSSVAHGSAKVIGELPPGVPLQASDGNMSQEAAAMLTLLKAIAESDLPVGIRPAASKTDFVANTSTAWQVFKELVANQEKAAARIYLGTDGTLGTQGGAPGVDITALFGVASTFVEGDLRAIERGLLTGSIEPWCALNFGDSRLAPQRVYLLPDSDADNSRIAMAQRRQSFYADIKAAKDSGFVITPEFLESVADEYGVDADTLTVVGATAAAPTQTTTPEAPQQTPGAPALRSVS